MKQKKIFIIAGEKSGDLLGSKIMQSLKSKTEKKAKIQFCGIGGGLMKKEGLKSLFPMEELSVMGVFEVLPRLFKIIKRINQTAKEIVKTKPDLVLTIDVPDFCFRVMKKVKNLDKESKIKKIHLIAPSVWVYREGRAEKISKLYDLLLCVLPFEPPYFEKHGLKTVFIGHPIFDKNYSGSVFNKAKFLKQSGAEKKDVVISLTPGSRMGEVKRLLPVAAKAISLLKKKNIFTFIFATEKTEGFIKSFIKTRNLKAAVILNEKDKYRAIKSSKIALAKSGTNTFEFVIHKVPMVVFYKFNWLTTFIAQKISKTKFANLVNIIAKKEIISECVLDRCKPKLIKNKLEYLLKNDSKRKQQVKRAQEIVKQLGYLSKKSSSDKGAQEILKLIK